MDIKYINSQQIKTVEHLENSNTIQHYTQCRRHQLAMAKQLDTTIANSKIQCRHKKLIAIWSNHVKAHQATKKQDTTKQGAILNPMFLVLSKGIIK